MNLAPGSIKKTWQNLPLWCPIMGSHIHRLGVCRVCLGALGMYLSIPMFVIVHGVVIHGLLGWVVYPILGFDRLNTGRFIILDRYKIKGLSAVDKLHCLFCGWANGVCTFLNHSVDLISQAHHPLTRGKRTMLALICGAYTLLALPIQILFCFVYNYLIAPPLNLEKVYYGGLIRRYFYSQPYGRSHPPWARRFLTWQKVCWAGLDLALGHIESAWCPIRHFEKMNNVVYPDHHKLFFKPHQIHELRSFLKQYGSVQNPKNH